MDPKSISFQPSMEKIPAQRCCDNKCQKHQSNEILCQYVPYIGPGTSEDFSNDQFFGPVFCAQISYSPKPKAGKKNTDDCRINNNIT